MASVCGGRDHDRELYSEEYFASEVSHYIMTVFAFLHIQNILSHKSAEGENMNKKLRVSLLTLPGSAGSLLFAQVTKRVLSSI